jgi:CheY-like chemotaxis protein
MQRLEAVGQLTAGVAHDFNNLLTVVLGNVALLRPGLADPTALRRLEQMHLAAERGAKLTRQLLAFARRQRLDPRPADLNQVLAAMHDLLQSTMGGSIRIETELTGGLWPAMVDPTQLELVVLNLAINARDAMPSGGTLAVRTANATVTEPPRRAGEPAPGDYVAVSVADDGIGMTPEILAKAFEPFFTTKEVGRGSGLGLAQVYGFATQSGGGVRVETTHGDGTTVTVYVPRASEAAPERVARDGGGVALDGRGRRILLVDDDDAVREVTGARLRALGFDVAEAASGETALAALEHGDDPALLLLDLAMPGMNGLDVARRARQRRPGLALLFLTGHADQAAIREFGDALILQKPVDDAQLAARLRAALHD